MELVEQHRENAIILEPHGRIDSTNAQDFTEQLTKAVGSGASRVIVDLEHLAYISSAGFRSLLIAAKQAKKSGLEFCLCSVEGKIRQLFELGGFLHLFPIHESRDSAVSE